MGKICEQFEAETPTDSEAAQKARFEMVLDLMQQVRLPFAICPLTIHLSVKWRRLSRKDAILLNHLDEGENTRDAVLHGQKHSEITNQTFFPGPLAVF